MRFRKVRPNYLFLVNNVNTLLEVTLAGLDSYLNASPAYPKIDVIRSRCRGMLRAYVDLYGQADADGYSVIAVEELVTGPILNPSTLRDSGYLAAGKIDVRAIKRKGNKHVIIDHKILASEMTDHHHEHLLVDTQPLQYALLQHLNGERVDGAVWDVIAKTSHRPKVKETTAEFEERVYELYSESPASFFARKEIPILEYNLAGYATDLHSWTQMVNSAKVSNTHLKTPESCFSYRYPCKFLSLCSGTGSLDRELQRGNLVQIDNPHQELNLPEGIDPHKVITNSRLKTFRNCMYKHDLSYNQGVRKPGHTEEPLFVGSAMHTALEHYWLHLKQCEQTEAA